MTSPREPTAGTPGSFPAQIVYATFPTTRRSGGVHVMMQHVRLLSAAGYSAWLWLPGPDGAPDWFDDDLPVRFGPELTLGADDLLVLPEVPVVPGRDPAPGARKVIFNQNHFYTYAAAAKPDADDPPYPGWSPMPSVWTVSQEGLDVLGALHAHLDVRLVPNFVDSARFRPRTTPTDRAGSEPGPRLSVVWFSRKRPRESSLVHRLLSADPRLAGIDLHEVTDEPWPVVADLLAAATVFIAFGHTEGFGLPVAEALAAGCLIVGYDGGGGHELFEAPGAWPVPEQRPILLVERVVDLVRREPDLRPLAAANRAWLLERYGPDRTRDALMEAVDAARAQPGAAATAVHPSAWLDTVPPNFHLTG